MKPKGIASVTGTTRSAYPRLTVLTGQDHATSVVVKVGTVWNRPETGSQSQREQAQGVNLQRPDGARKQRRPPDAPQPSDMAALGQATKRSGRLAPERGRRGNMVVHPLADFWRQLAYAAKF